MTVDQIIETARSCVETAHPRLGRIEVGEAALGRLIESAGADASQDERDAVWGAVTPGGGGLLGVPLVLNDDLDPDAWRLLDTDDEVIKEGTL